MAGTLQGRLDFGLGALSKTFTPSSKPGAQGHWLVHAIDNEAWQSKITNAGHKALNNLKNGPWNHSRWKEILEQSGKFSVESELSEETARKHLLDVARDTVRSLDLQSLVSIRLCMLGTSCVVLPRKLNRLLTDSELESINSAFIERGLASMITEIDH